MTKPIHSSHSMPIYAKPKSMKRHDQVFDANRNHIIPYYYSETVSCMPNVYKHTNRHTFANYSVNDNNSPSNRYRFSPRVQSRLASPELAHLFNNISIQNSQPFRPYSVLEPCRSPTSIERPTSVIQGSDAQFRPASAFFQREVDRVKDVPDWKLRLRKETDFKTNMLKETSFRQACRIPNCKCNVTPAVDPRRFDAAKTLPIESERSLNKIRNLSLPSLKIGSEDGHCAEKDTTPKEKDKSVAEQHLGYV